MGASISSGAEEFAHVRFPSGIESIIHTVPSPAWVIDLASLRRNLQTLRTLADAAGCRVLLAQKGYAAFRTYPLVAEYLDGACASSPHEARLAREELGKEVHAYAPAWKANEIDELADLADHVLFNSVNQLRAYAPVLREIRPRIEIGLRVNPQHREGSVDLYDPCAPGSRLGVTAGELSAAGDDIPALDGLHFHTLCEADADALERTVTVFEERFAKWIPGLRWVNFGGGHHITKPGYDLKCIQKLITSFRERWGTEAYIEPGEAVGLNVGVLVAEVLDIVHPEDPVAILDISATAHMPDVLEMPYRPTIPGAGQPGEKAHTYRLGGTTCLAGDVIGSYSFDHPLAPGDRLIFGDMAHYTMVKATTFNGVALPSIIHRHEDGTLEIVRNFGYEDFRSRLG